ncbi:MAG: elongation factor Ts [Patescibacteria group bacterium]
MISTSQIKELRQQSGGVSIAECRSALERASGDMSKALEFLKESSAKLSAKKAGRVLGAGYIHSYIHGGGAIGTLVELRAETDFVAKNPDFHLLADDIALQISATSPADVTSLLTEPFIKDPAQSIADLIKNAVQRFGERVEISRFARFAAGE